MSSASRPLRVLLVALAAAALSTVANANGAQDGEAGLAAMQAGDYAHAVALFTRALDDRALVRADRVLAHLSRGRAWLALNQKDKAIADFRRAVAIDPSDQDAQAALRAATQDAASPSAGGPAPTAARRASGDLWGFLGKMAGHYYWYEVPNTASRSAYGRFDWVVTGQSLAFALHERSRDLQVGLYRADLEAGRLLGASVVQRAVRYTTVDAGEDKMIEYGFVQGAPVRETTTLGRDGVISAVTQVWRDGVWRDYASNRLIEVSPEDLTAAGFHLAVSPGVRHPPGGM
jgi:tetratricopeptide (TPR) repeat protein